MREIYLKTPTFDELTYRKKLLSDKETMSYNNNTIDFNESKWKDWYNKWIGNNNPDFFYAYIYDKEASIPVGEVAYRLDEETGCGMLNIIVEASKRGNGYGYSGLLALIKIAFKNRYIELRDLIYTNSVSSYKLFEKVGFKCINELNNIKDYRMTIEEYKSRYGQL